MSGLQFTRLFIVMAAACLVTALLAPAVPAHELPKGFAGFEDPATCGGCHASIYEEWKGSMHAKSSKFNDPLHSAVYGAFAAAMAAQGKPANYHCASCHTPTADNMAALMKGEAVPDPDDKTDVDGVTCSFCHRVDAVIEGDRINTYRLAAGIKGPAADVKAPHGASAWSFETTSEMCLGCHGKMINGKGGVVCSMDEEGQSDCIPCHMPKTEGAPAAGSTGTEHAFHGIFGGHNKDMLAKGATVSLALEEGKLVVTLRNPNPHYFPSTNPLRVAYVKVEAFDENGKSVFTNFGKDPSEDPGALLIRVFKAGDKVGVPSWEAEGVAKDTRLRPGEERRLVYTLPEGADIVKAKLFYRFVPAKAIEKFGIKPDGTVEVPQLVSEAELAL